MILDLHAHSIKSDDGRAKVQNYCQWIKTRDIQIDGFVLTEHRQFDNESDYSGLAEEYGITILKGAEARAEWNRAKRNWINCHPNVARTPDDPVSKPERCVANAFGGYSQHDKS